MQAGAGGAGAWVGLGVGDGLAAGAPLCWFPLPNSGGFFVQRTTASLERSSG
jgi:hypothetical protein